MTKHPKNDSSASRAPSGQQQPLQPQQEAAPAAKPPKAPAGSVAEAEKKVAQNMANKATAEENIKFGVRKLADWTERLQARSSAPQGQSAVDEALAKEMAE
ncbi:hypothetical protein FPOA_08817 [Fusarium poae]|uniref:Uncharacterized protein n=1 Tax=Fusarium poae TaxID=36050 RepID=A0A1B8APQ3_FUSPO|nr:hypothetical protein FPOA_08817 [Fusarium poae]